MFRCKHNKVVISKKYSPVNPNKLASLKNISKNPDRLAEFALLGATTILVQCKKCKNYFYSVIPGDHTNEG